MLKFYLLLSLLIIMRGNLVNATDVVHRNGDGHESKPFKINTHESKKLKINFDEFQNKDPYELEELHQYFFKKKQFIEAAWALIGSAVKGDSENMDYLLKLDPKALQYINRKDVTATEELISKIAKDLARQFRYSEHEPFVNLPSPLHYQNEALPKKGK
jgi:hypothetical protein